MATLEPALIRIFDNLRLSLPGVLDGVLQIELWNVVDDYCRASNIWRETVAVDVTPDETEYDLVPETQNTEIARLMWLLDANDGTGKAVSSYLTNDGTLVIKSAPAAATTYYAEIALTPASTVVAADNPYPDVPDWVWIDHGTTIQAGVMARCMLQPAKPYTNAQLAATHAKMYRGGMLDARRETEKGNKYGAQRWSFPQAFAARRR